MTGGGIWFNSTTHTRRQPLVKKRELRTTVKQQCARFINLIFSSWLMERWRLKCWWRGWWSCSSSRRRRSAHRRRWLLALKGRGARAYPQVQIWLFTPASLCHSPVDSLLPLCLVSGGEGRSTWPRAASCGGTRIQIWGLCSQGRAVTTHHASTGSLECFVNNKPYFPFLNAFQTYHSIKHLLGACVQCFVDRKVVSVCVSRAGLFMGGPRLLSAQQASAWHGSAAGWEIPGTNTFHQTELH